MARTKEELLEKLAEDVVEMEDEDVVVTAKEYLDAGYPAMEGLMNGLVKGMSKAGELFDDRFGHGGELDDGDDGADGDDQEDGDDVDGDVDAALRSLAGAHAVVAAQLVVPQAVGPGRGIELQGLIGHALTIALSVNFSRLTKQLCDAQLDTFSLVRI